MSNSSNTANNELSGPLQDLAIPFSVRFWLFLISDILSVLCSLFVLCHLLFIQYLRQSLNNHTIITLLFLNLIYELTDMSFILHYYRLDGVWQVTPIFSQFWSFLDYGIYSTQIIVFAWSTVERHILIFHDRWLFGKKNRFCFHYLPLMILVLYCLIYYSLVAFYPFCEYSPSQSTINGVFVPCMYMNPIFAECDVVLNQIIPTLIIIIFSIALLVRVLSQNTRLRRPIQWRRQRKLTIQILSIAILYFCFQFPWTFFQFCILVGVPVYSAGNALNYTYFFSYYTDFLFPFVCCGSLSELRKKIKNFIRRRRQHRVIVPRPINTLNRQ